MVTRVKGAVSPNATEVFLTDGTSVEDAIAAGGGSGAVLATAASLSTYDGTEVVNTRGYNTADDGGGALYVHDAGSSATIDNGSVFAHPSSGRWILVPQNNIVTAHQFGCHVETDATLRFQALFDYAKGTDLTVKAWGQFDLTGRVFTDAHLDMTEAELTYPLDYADYGLVISPVFSIDILDYPASTRLRGKQLRLPKVITTKTGQGWSAGGRGVTLINLYHCEVHVNHIENFEYGLRLWGRQSTGCVYNTVYLGLVFNNQYNVHLFGDGSTLGWCNQNTFIGGVVAHDSSEVVTSGVRVAGTRHLYLQGVTGSAYAGPNNNTFVNVAIEGVVDEYAAFLINASYNEFINCRYEDGGTAAKAFRFQGSSRFNAVLYGYDAGDLDFSYISSGDGDPTNNHIFTNAGTLFTSASNTKPTLMLTQTTSNVYPSVASYDNGLSPEFFGNTNYRGALNGFGVVHRLGTDTADRVQLASGAVKLGNGSSAPTSRISGDDNSTIFTNGDVELFDSNFSQQRLRFGNYYLWVDTSGVLRIKNGEPTTATDGTVVGSQS